MTPPLQQPRYAFLLQNRPHIFGPYPFLTSLPVHSRILLPHPTYLQIKSTHEQIPSNPLFHFQLHKMTVLSEEYQILEDEVSIHHT